MFKRGLSSVIATLLIILIAISAASLFWFWLKPTISQTLESNQGIIGNNGNVASSCLNVDLNIVSCVYDEERMQIKVRRGPGEAEIDGVGLLFYKNGGVNIRQTFSSIPDVFESRIYGIADSTLFDSQIDVYSIIGDRSSNPSGLPVRCIYGETSPDVILIDEPACSDNIDNDGDLFIDWPSDPGCSSEDDSNENDPQRRDSFAFTWSDLDYGQYTNLIRIVQYYPFTVGSPWPVTSPENVASKLRTLPDGKKAIMMFNLGSYHDVITNNNLDNCRDPGGQLTSIRCLWWDNGVANARAYTDNLFSALSLISQQDSSVDVDYVFIDFERGFSNNLISQSMSDAIEQDSRFNSVDPLLGESIPILTGVNNLDWAPGWGGYQFLAWNSVMGHRVDSYINKVFLEPALERYPGVKVSNYGSPDTDIIDCDYPMPDINGHGGYCLTLAQFPGRDHNYIDYFGNVPGPQIYGDLGQVTWPNRGPNGMNYPNGAFNSFRYSVNQARQPVLIYNRATIPWIAPKNFAGDLGLLAMSGNDYYDESVLHALLLNPDSLFFWNPTLLVGENEREVSELMDEFDKVAGFDDRSTMLGRDGDTSDSFGNGKVWKELSPWDNDFVLTGMMSGGRKVWRFSPMIDGGLIDSASDSLLGEDSSGVRFQTGEFEIFFPGGKVWTSTSPASENGFWIVQPSSAGEPEITRVNWELLALIEMIL